MIVFAQIALCTKLIVRIVGANMEALFVRHWQGRMIGMMISAYISRRLKEKNYEEKSSKNLVF